MSYCKPNAGGNVNLVIDGRPVSVPEGTTILEAARKAGVDIPTLCHHPDLCKRALCRLCVVECDGRGKLVAACANEVWEGVNVATDSSRILGIRKTILEMILAGHPRECLTCIRGRDCELRNLAIRFGLREPVLSQGSMQNRKPVTENDTIVRDMDKCVKCGRCMEVCHGVQTIGAINSSGRSIHYTIDTPYNQNLTEGPCVFCGQCAEVCPVGAIYGHDQSHEAWVALRNSGLSKNADSPVRDSVVVQFEPTLDTAFDSAMGLPPGTVTPGKVASALRRLGFDMVFDMRFSKNATLAEESRELLARIKSGDSRLPMLSGCSKSMIRFTMDFFPDLAGHLSRSGNPVYIFGSLDKGTEAEKTTCISIVPCLAKKYVERGAMDLVLTVNETAGMFRLAGIDLKTIEESPFDVMPGKTQDPMTFDAANFREPRKGVREAEITVSGTGIKLMTVQGFGNARAVMDSIRRGECDAHYVKVMNCPMADCSVPAGCEMASILRITGETRG